MDSVEQIISEVHTKLNAILGGTPIPYGVGNLKEAEQGAPPRITWVEPSGTFENSQKIGGVEANQWTLRSRLQIWIWHTSVELARDVMLKLAEAIRATTYGPNAVLVGYDVPTQVEGRWLEHGELFIMRVDWRLPVLNESNVLTITIESHEGTVTADTQTDYTVTVQGPPA